MVYPTKRSRRSALILLVGLALGACAPKYYVPNTHNTPLLEYDGDFTAAVATGDSRAELQGAYAVSDEIGVMANLAFFEQKDDSVGAGGNGGIAEIGVGYQRPLSNGLSFEIYGLLGGGNVENHLPYTVADNPGTTGVIESRLFRYGMQPALGFRYRNVQIAASTRVMGLRYSDVSGSLVYEGEDQVAYLRSLDTQMLVEPAITIRAGLETVKLQMQLGRSFNLSDSDFRQDNGHLTVGILYSPPRRPR